MKELITTKMIVGNWYKLNGHKESLQLRRVGVKGFNFCNEFTQKVFKNNFYVNNIKVELFDKGNDMKGVEVHLAIPDFIYCKLENKDKLEVSSIRIKK